VVAELAGLRSLRDARRRLAHHQRNLSRTQKGSANRRKAAARLAHAHARVAAVRSQALHRFSAQLACARHVIVIEDLATAQLLGNHSLAGAIADQGWAELARQLAYKTDWHGGTLIVADRWYPSSKTCSCCGWVKPKLSLAERTYRCDNPACGHAADRDVDAAANLAAWGETHPREREGGPIQDGDRHPGGPTAGTCRHACGGSNEPSPDRTPRQRHDRTETAGASGEPGTSQPLTRVAQALDRPGQGRLHPR
jgi:putative transposase